MNESSEKVLSHEIPHSLDLAKRLEDSDDDVEIRSHLWELLESISSDIHMNCTDDANRLYETMRRHNCLARVERLSRVLETIELGIPLHIAEDTDSHYANAVIPINDGLKIAFSEGRAPGQVKVVVGFGKTLIGFKTDHMKVEEITFSESDLRDSEKRKYLCRHVTGDLLKDDIMCIIMRIPRHLMTDELLNDKERKSKQPFVIRGFVLNDKN